MSLGTPSGTLPGSRHAMCVVEAYQPSARWLVQGEGIGQTVGPSLVRFDSLDPELEPISLFEVVNAPVKGEKKLDLMFRTRIFHILTGYSSSLQVAEPFRKPLPSEFRSVLCLGSRRHRVVLLSSS